MNRVGALGKKTSFFPSKGLKQGYNKSHRNAVANLYTHF